MGKITVFESVTLDGVMQAPGSPDEDRRGGFEHGGWAAPYSDEATAAEAGKGMATTKGILLGRLTYENFYGFWPHQKDNPYTDVLNNTQKYVVSTTLSEPLPWMNSTLVKSAGDLPGLKDGIDGDIVVLGSSELVQTLIRQDLIDTYILLIHPVYLGTGTKLFREQGRLRLVEAKTTSTGVVIATYVTGS